MNRSIRRAVWLLAPLLLGIAAAGQTMIVTATGGGPPDGIDPLSAPLPLSRAVAVDGGGAAFFFSNDIIFQITSDRRLRRVAGTSAAGFGGDGGAALQAQFSIDALPIGANALAVDAADHLLVADFGNSRLRQVDLISGVITTIAGTGVASLSGDEGPAASAELNAPAAVAVDAAGNIYLADYRTNRVRQIDPSGTIHNFAGSGCFRHDWVVCYPPRFSNGAYEVGDGGPATGGTVYEPFQLVIEGDDLYIVDYTGLRRVHDGVITTVLQNGFLCGSSPVRIAAATVLGGGQFLVLDGAGNRVCFVDANGHAEAIAGGVAAGFGGDGGPAAAALLSGPSGMALDSAGTLYIADTTNARLRAVPNAGSGVAAGQQTISTFAGSGAVDFYEGATGPESELSAPAAVKLDAKGNLYIADPAAGLVRRVDALSGAVSTIAGVPACAGACSANLLLEFRTPATTTVMRPVDVAPEGLDAILIADTVANRIWRVTLATGAITAYAGSGATGNSGDGGPAVSASFQLLGGLALDSSGNLLISDAGANVIRRVDGKTGIITRLAGSGAAGFAGDNGPALSAQLNTPSGLSTDAAGAVYPADSLNNRVRKIYRDNSGNWLIGTAAGGCGGGDCSHLLNGGDGLPATSAMLASPTAVTIDSDGNLFIADRDNHRVRRVDADTGLISTFAGSGCFSGATSCAGSFAGDGGAAEGSNLNEPVSVAIGPDASLYIADSLNHRVRRVDVPACDITPAAVTFPPQLIGSSSSLSVSMHNRGRLAMQLGAIEVQGFPYSTTCGTTLAPGNTCNVVLSFEPTSSGQYSGTLLIPEGASSDRVAISAQAIDLSLNLTRPQRPARGVAPHGGVRSRQKTRGLPVAPATQLFPMFPAGLVFELWLASDAGEKSPGISASAAESAQPSGVCPPPPSDQDSRTADDPPEGKSKPRECAQPQPAKTE